MRGATLEEICDPLIHRISIHAPRAGCDGKKPWIWSNCIYFNPRTPCGVRPKWCIWSCRTLTFQSTHPVRGATGKPLKPDMHSFRISIHAPRAGCDPGSCGPVGRGVPISIHAPRAGCDVAAAWARGRPTYFNPRTPCGVRLLAASAMDKISSFQSTHPVRGATPCGKLPGA